MILGKVLTNVVSTEKNKALHARKILVVQPLNTEMKPVSGGSGTPFLALDTVQAGEGDIVIVCREGNGCRQILEDDGAPVNAVIAGIVDHIQAQS